MFGQIDTSTPSSPSGADASRPGATSVAAAQTVKAFPTAEGFGANARGGRGGRVIEVTTFDDSGAGSLRAAPAGPARVIVMIIITAACSPSRT